MNAQRKPILEFWYEFASSYSYLSAVRIEEAAAAAGVEIHWRVFLLGPIFAAQGWTTSPFNLFPAKGRYMWRDMEREAASLGVPLRQPPSFPVNSLLAARVAMLAEGESWGPDFAQAVFRSEFGQGRDISDPGVLGEVLHEIGLDPAATLAAAQDGGNKSRLKQRGEEARARGIFGAPTFLTHDGEMFWGNDRLEAALAWAANGRPAKLPDPT